MTKLDVFFKSSSAFRLFSHLSCPHMLTIISFLVCLLLVLSQESNSLRMKNFEVPLHVPRGESTTLKCEFDLEGERLYSIKWYKGGREFFRYVPNERPMKQQYHVQGVTVDLESSTGQRVVLRNVNLSTSGRYKCEVLGEAPSFDTLTEHAILTVVDIPDEKPIVRGASEKYHPGDLVRVNCTSARSKPAATLKWFINRKLAPVAYLIRYRPIMYPDGLEESTLGLHFRASHAHFPGGSMSLRCTATIGVFLEQQQQENSTFSHFPALSLKSKEHTYGSHGVKLTASVLCPFTLLLFLVAAVVR